MASLIIGGQDADAQVGIGEVGGGAPADGPPSTPTFGEAFPLPVRRRLASIALLTLGVCLLQSTLAPVAAQTVYPTQQTTLLIARPQSPRFDPPNLLLSTLGIAPAPFTQSDWDTPRARTVPLAQRTHVHPLPLVLLEQDTFFGAPGQGTVSDWPTPTPCPSATSLRTWTQSLNTTTLAPIIDAPVTPVEWPTPARVATPLGHRTHVDWRALGLVDERLVGQAAIDTPAVSLRGPVETRTSNLLESTLASPDAAPFAQTDWPLPTRRAGLLITTQTRPSADPVVVGTPVAPIAWTLPLATPYPLGLRTFTDGRKAFHVDLTPASLTDWPIPSGTAPARELRTWLQNLLQSTLSLPVGTPTHHHDDWPTPQGRVDLLGLSWVINLQQSTLAPAVATAPFTGVDWPIPARRRALGLSFIEYYALDDTVPFAQREWPSPLRGLDRRSLLAWTQNLLESTLFIPPPALPTGRLLDWPVPTGPGHATSLRTWLQERKAYYVDLTPAALREWPTPQGKGHALELRTSLQNLLQSTLVPTPMPFVQTAWPLAVGKAHPIDLRTFLHEVQFQLRDTFFGEPGQPPANMDWPRPGSKRWPVVEGSHGLSTLLIPPFAALAPAWVIRVPEWPQTILVAEQPQIILVPEWPEDLEIP